MTMKDAYVLVIGIANYQHMNKLPLTVLNDAKDIRDLLVDPKHCGYPSGNVHLLLGEEATKKAILSALAALGRRSGTGSTIFIYIPSHGGRIETGASAGTYLLPVDAVYTSTQVAKRAFPQIS